MTLRRWTRDELVGLLSDGLVSALDQAGRTVEVPAWLKSRALGHMPFDASESVDVVHRDDRGTMIAHFMEALNAPGDVLRTRFRARYEGVWRHTESTAINLLHDPDVGCVVFSIREVEGDGITDEDQQMEGDQAATNWMLMTLTESGLIAGVEGNVRAMLGYEVDEILGRLPTDFIPSESLAQVIRLWLELVEHPEATRVCRHRWIRKDGSDVWIESSYVNRGSNATGDDRVLVVMWDITERRAAEAALQKMAEDFRLLADEVPAAVFRCDPTGAVTFHNSRWDELFAERGEITRLHDLIEPEAWATLDERLGASRDLGAGQRSSVDLVGPEETVWRLTLRSLAFRGADEPEFIGSLQDITATVKLHRDATYDAVTGLLNRAAIERRLDALLGADRLDAVVLFIDLDRFKAVNDDFGHDAGDAVLAAVADRLSETVRAVDSVGRWGGDEFVVVFVDADASEQTLIDRVQRAFAEPIVFDDGVWETAASIGAARCMRGDDVDAVVSRADRAMLAVKRERHGGTRSTR